MSKIRIALPDARNLDPQTINSKYEASVIRACDRHFEGLIPLRAGKDNLYTHLFRAIYGTIATFWYCPPNVNEVEFKAVIQGHYAILDETNEQLKRSIATSRHYSDYEIADAVIARHGGKRRGIKLTEPGVKIVSPFNPKPKPAPDKHSKTKRHFSTVRIFKDDKQLLEEIFQQLKLDTTLNQSQKMSEFLHWAASTATVTKSDQLSNPVTVSITADTLESNSQTQQENDHNTVETVEVKVETVEGKQYTQQDNVVDDSDINNLVVAAPFTKNEQAKEGNERITDGVEDHITTATAIGPETLPETLADTSTVQQSQQATNQPVSVLIEAKLDQLIDVIATQQTPERLEAKFDKFLDLMSLFVSSTLQKPQRKVASHSNIAVATPTTSDSNTNTLQPELNTGEDFKPTNETGDSTTRKEQPSPNTDESKKDTSSDSSIPRIRRRITPLTEKAINKAIDSIIAHNSTPELLHDLKWALTINTIKELVSDVTKSQGLIQKILTERGSEIEQHHQFHSIDPAKHNHRHKRKRKIVEVINPITFESIDESDSQSNTQLLGQTQPITSTTPEPEAEDDFVTLASKFLSDDNPWRKLTGLIAATGATPDNLLKIFLIKGVEDKDTILYTLQLHPKDAPFLKLTTLVDAQRVENAIATLKNHPELKPHIDTHTGKEINALFKERIADYLGQLGAENYSIAIEQYHIMAAEKENSLLE